MSALVAELRAAMAALVFFSRLPVPAQPLLDADDMRRAATYWPLVGLVVGGAMAGAWWLAARVWPPGIAAGFALAAGILATGALEQDGVADVGDGFAAGPARARILEVMHDSRLGATGAIALAVMTGLRWQALVALPAAMVPAVLVATQALSRTVAVALMALLPYLREAGSRAHPVVGRLPMVRLSVALVTGLVPLMLVPAPLRPMAALAAAAALLACASWFGRRLGGYTGDCVGATQQCAELALLLAAVVAA
jgi:adenosylcobinamide-GDP ribazoletransferase